MAHKKADKIKELLHVKMIHSFTETNFEPDHIFFNNENVDLILN